MKHLKLFFLINISLFCFIKIQLLFLSISFVSYPFQSNASANDIAMQFNDFERWDPTKLEEHINLKSITSSYENF